MPPAELRPDTRSLREQRDRQRVLRAGALARAKAKSAMAVALAEIGAAFDEAAAINAFKLRVERLMRLSPHHPAVRARFGAHAVLLSGCDFDVAIDAVERRWRQERKAFQIASALGCATRLSLEVLRELRLILRLMRRKRMQAEYETALAAACGAPMATAAE